MYGAGFYQGLSSNEGSIFKINILLSCGEGSIDSHTIIFILYNSRLPLQFIVNNIVWHQNKRRIYAAS